MRKAAAVAAVAAVASALGLPALLVAAGGKATLTPGWDSYPALADGWVAWSIVSGSTTLEVTYALDGAAASQEHQVGVHHFDVVGDPNLGAGTTETGSGAPVEITREGNTSTISADEIGFLTTDAGGDVQKLFTLAGVNPGIYGVQFHVRQGGSPGCPTTSCNAIYRTGGVFAGELVRFAVPGAAAFWSGDGDSDDELGSNGALWSGTEAYRDGFFREGFDLAGDSYLSVPDPGTSGLASASGFTVAARIVQDVFSSTASVINLRTPTNASGFTLEPQYLTPGTFLFAVNTTGVAEGFATITVAGFPTGVPIQVAATFDAATHAMRLYRDGQLVGLKSDVPGTTMALLGTEELQIGRNLLTGAMFDGLIDELLYFDRALTPEEIRGLSATLFADGFEVGGTGQWSTAVGG